MSFVTPCVLILAVATSVSCAKAPNLDGKAVHDKLEALAKDPERAQADQDLLLKIALDTSDIGETNRIWRETNSVLALQILSSVRAPSKRTIETLAAGLEAPGDEQRPVSKYRKDVIVRVLGRMGPKAGIAIPYVERFYSGHRPNSEVLRRISGQAPESHPTQIASDSFRSWSGSLSLEQNRGAHLIQTDAVWRKLWSEKIGLNRAPEIDFSKHSVIAYFDGPNGALIGLKPVSFERSSSSTTLVLEEGNSDAIDFFADYPYLMLEVQKIRTPLTVTLSSWRAMSDGKRRARVIAHLDRMGRTLTNP